MFEGEITPFPTADKLTIVKLHENLQNIKDRLPKIYDHYIQMLDGSNVKPQLEDESNLFKSLSKKINDFLRIKEIDLLHLIRFSKLMMSHLEAVHLRLSQSESIFLPTKEINELIENLKRDLIQTSSPSGRPMLPDDVLNKEKLAFIVQCQLNKNNISKKLKELPSLAVNEGLFSKEVYICHSWPLGKLHHEEWTNQFAHQLQAHLEATGLKVYIDLEQSNCGSPLLEFMTKHIRTAAHVIFICDRTLEYKFEEIGVTGIMFEYLQAIKRWKLEKPPRFIIPLCLTQDNYVPGLLGNFAALSTYDNGYIAVLKELIGRIYTFHKPAFNAWWADSIETLPISDEMGSTLTRQTSEQSPPLPSHKLAFISEQLTDSSEQKSIVTSQSVSGQTTLPSLHVEQGAVEQTNHTVAMISGETVKIDELKTGDEIRSFIYIKGNDIPPRVLQLAQMMWSQPKSLVAPNSSHSRAVDGKNVTITKATSGDKVEAPIYYQPESGNPKNPGI